MTLESVRSLKSSTGTHLFHYESGSLCFLLGHLLQFYCLCELFPKGQMCLGQGRREMSKMRVPIRTFLLLGTTHHLTGRKPACITEAGGEKRKEVPLPQRSYLVHWTKKESHTMFYSLNSDLMETGIAPLM